MIYRIAASAALVLLTACGQALAQTDRPIAPSAEEATPLKVGDKVPDATVRTTAGQEVSLPALLREGGPAAIVFYRGGWCPYCATQLKGLKDAKEDLTALGYQILAVAPESWEDVKKFSEEHTLDYALVSDPTLAAARGFGVAFYLGAEKAAAYRGYGATVPEGALPVPSVFLANADGEITFVYSDPDYKVRLSTEDLVKAARAQSEN